MTHYETLGVAPNATAAQIKAAFRKLASLHHPDRGGDKEKSAAVNDAYACLSDPERRTRYDAGERDTVGPTPEEAHALRVQMILHAAMNDALDKPETETLGVVSSVRRSLKTAAKNAKDGAAKAASDAERLERMKAKVRRKAAAGHDIVTELIDGRIQVVHRFAEQAKTEQRELTDALTLLDDYEEDAPAGAAIVPRPALFNDMEIILAQMSAARGYR